jgi:hypothetical protein
MEAYEANRVTDEKAAQIIKIIARVKHCQQLQNFDAEKRKGILIELKVAGLSIRQIERLTGINRGVILRSCQ